MGQKCQGDGSFEKGRGKECGYESACLPLCSPLPSTARVVPVDFITCFTCTVEISLFFQNSEENFGLTHDPLT